MNLLSRVATPLVALASFGCTKEPVRNPQPLDKEGDSKGSLVVDGAATPKELGQLTAPPKTERSIAAVKEIPAVREPVEPYILPLSVENVSHSIQRMGYSVAGIDFGRLGFQEFTTRDGTKGRFEVKSAWYGAAISGFYRTESPDKKPTSFAFALSGSYFVQDPYSQEAAAAIAVDLSKINYRARSLGMNGWGTNGRFAPALGTVSLAPYYNHESKTIDVKKLDQLLEDKARLLANIYAPGRTPAWLDLAVVPWIKLGRFDLSSKVLEGRGGDRIVLADLIAKTNPTLAEKQDGLVIAAFVQEKFGQAAFLRVLLKEPITAVTGKSIDELQKAFDAARSPKK